MVLTCTHPPLDPPTYLPTVILEMNGMDIPSIHTPINSTATTLSVRVTRKGFQNDMTAMFGCVILQRATNSTFAEVKSSKQTVTAACKCLLQPIYIVKILYCIDVCEY